MYAFARLARELSAGCVRSLWGGSPVTRLLIVLALVGLGILARGVLGPIAAQLGGFAVLLAAMLALYGLLLRGR